MRDCCDAQSPLLVRQDALTGIVRRLYWAELANLLVSMASSAGTDVLAGIRLGENGGPPQSFVMQSI